MSHCVSPRVILPALLLALSAIAQAADPGFYLRDTKGQRDIGGLNENFRGLADSSRRAQNDVDDVADDIRAANNTWTGTNAFQLTTTVNGNAVMGASTTLSGLLTGLGSSLFFATMTMTTSESLNFSVMRASFTPAIPAGVSTIGALIVIPVVISCGAPGGEASSCTLSHTSGSPFNGTMVRTGMYLNVAIADRISFTLTFNGAGGGSGTGTWLIVALL